MAKHRSLRMLKKLHLGPFQQLGFGMRCTLKPGLDEAALDALLWDFVGDCIEANGLVFGGGIESGWIDRDGRDSATDTEREIVRSWLAARPEVASCDIGPLRDSWYGPFDDL